MKEITARLWENKMYGTTFAKGQYRKAIYNGTLEIMDPYAKYLVDFEGPYRTHALRPVPTT